MGPIKAYAWPLLVQAAKLAERHGKKLALTKAGRQALGTPAADTLQAHLAALAEDEAAG